MKRLWSSACLVIVLVVCAFAQHDPGVEKVLRPGVPTPLLSRGLLSTQRGNQLIFYPNQGFEWVDPAAPDNFAVRRQEAARTAPAPTPAPAVAGQELPPCISMVPQGIRVLGAKTPRKQPDAQHYEISGMSKVEAQQKEEAWCWAAVIQIVARAERVPLDQRAVVVDVKGKLKVEGANFEEITRYFGVGWHGQPGQPGTWTSDSLSFRITPGVNGAARTLACREKQ